MCYGHGRIRRAVFIGVTLFLILRAGFALGDISVSFTPENPRVGEYVDVTITTDADRVKGVRYVLSMDGKKIGQNKKNEKHLITAFRPRKEGVYTLEITVTEGGNRTESASVSIPVSGTAPVQRGEDVLYSQMDGWWQNEVYSTTYTHTLETSGCALFTLSHALQRMGFDSDEVLPDQLAVRFGEYFTEGVGARTEAVITKAGLYFGYQTVHRLVTAEDEIISFLQRGDCFCLGIVPRHVCLVDGVDEESQKLHIVDSYPEMTLGKLGRIPAYIRGGDGTWQTIRSADEIPGIRWFFETAHFGGGGYWLDLDDCAARGLRLIRRPWLTLETENGKKNVSADWFGTVISSVKISNKAQTVSTGSLQWLCTGADGPRLAVVTKENGAALTHRNGETFKDFKPVPWGRILCALQADSERVYVYWRGTFCYVNRSDVELIAVPEQDYPTAVISAEGKHLAAAARSYQQPDASSASAAEWPVGTEIIIIDQADGFCFAEGLGCRGWITMDQIDLCRDGE